MNLIMFIVGGCLGLAFGAGAVTLARTADDEAFCKKIRAELKALSSEIDTIRDEWQARERNEREY